MASTQPALADFKVSGLKKMAKAVDVRGSTLKRDELLGELEKVWNNKIKRAAMLASVDSDDLLKKPDAKKSSAHSASKRSAKSKVVVSSSDDEEVDDIVDVSSREDAEVRKAYDEVVTAVAKLVLVSKRQCAPK